MRNAEGQLRGKIDRDRLAEMIRAGVSREEAAKELGFSPTTIKCVCNQMGLYLGTRADRHRVAHHPKPPPQVCPRCRKKHNDRPDMSKWAYCNSCLKMVGSDE